MTKTRSGKSRDYRDVIVVEKRRFHNVFRSHVDEKPAFSNSCGLKSVFEKPLFSDGLVWMVDLTVEIKLRFQTFQTGVVRNGPEFSRTRLGMLLNVLSCKARART